MDIKQFLKSGVCALSLLTAGGVFTANATPDDATETSAATEDAQYVWDLTDVYETTDDWDTAYEEVMTRIEGLSAYRGTLGNSAADMADAMQEVSDTAKETIRL